MKLSRQTTHKIKLYTTLATLTTIALFGAYTIVILTVFYLTK